MKSGRKKNDQINAKGEWEPTSKQKECIKLEFEGKSHREIANTLGIHETTIVMWFKNEKFLDYLEKERDLQFKKYGVHIDKSLISVGLKGNVGAIRTYYEKRGEIKTGSNNGQTNNIIISFPAMEKGHFPDPIEVKAEVKEENKI
jgi:hypothetical protein